MSSITIKVPNWLDRICAWPMVVYRQWTYGYTYRRIYLSEGKWTIVEPRDFYWLNNFRCCAKGDGQCIYAVRFVIEADKRAKIVTMHREMMNAPPGILVDHRNNDGLDNRRDNLRLATSSQNNINCRRNKSKSSSRFVGVTFDKRKKQWRVRISVNRKRIFLGYFDSEIDAAKAYDEAAKKYYGEFARLNFPENSQSPSK
jgi:hypothetical protein